LSGETASLALPAGDVRTGSRQVPRCRAARPRRRRCRPVTSAPGSRQVPRCRAARPRRRRRRPV